MNVSELSPGGRQLGKTSCLPSAGRVTLAGGTTFLHINTFARLPGTTLESEMKNNLAKPTVIE